MHWAFYSFFWPAFWILFWSGRSFLRHRQKMAELRLLSQQAAAQTPSANTDEVANLRERVKVLERITVDERQSRELATEIESLRDR
ncbi:MAG: hypothetical protein ACKOQM_14850 [Novosphingobium sp.]